MPAAAEIPSFNGELGEVIDTIVKSGQYGSPFVRASSRSMDSARTRTGILACDLALGGGWTTSRAHMLYGEKSSGKTTLALKSIATLQRDDPYAITAWVDVEGTLDKSWARKIGCDLERIVVVQPETGEHAVDLADAMLRAKEIKMVVMDSIAMLVPMKELDESSMQDTMAIQARLVGKYVRRTNNGLLKERMRGHSPTLININQFRTKVGLVFGDPRVLPGGKALEFSTTQQLECKNKEILKDDSDGNSLVIYNEHDLKVTKNKGGGPMKEAKFKLIRQINLDGCPEGWVDQAKSMRAFGIQVGVCIGGPTSFEYDDVNYKFKSAEDFNTWAVENSIAYNRLQNNIVDAFRKRWDLV
jgi:recombination protein RecA